jgi:hypothetical protein
MDFLIWSSIISIPLSAIHYFNFESAIGIPSKANAPLVADTNYPREAIFGVTAIKNSGTMYLQRLIPIGDWQFTIL